MYIYLYYLEPWISALYTFFLQFEYVVGIIILYYIIILMIVYMYRDAA